MMDYLIACVGEADFRKLTGMSRQVFRYNKQRTFIKGTTASGRIIYHLFCQSICWDERQYLLKFWAERYTRKCLQDGTFFASQKNFPRETSASAMVSVKKYREALHTFFRD